jgi:hypothetical protein
MYASPLNLRRSLIAKLIAVWFVTLIVLPFTAPFQTWDPAAPPDTIACHDVKAADKLSKDPAMLAPLPAPVPEFVYSAPGAGRVNMRARLHRVALVPLRI